MNWLNWVISALKKVNKAVKQLGCCDLCDSDISLSGISARSVEQMLVCQHCFASLPLFKQEVLCGNLLSWPAIHRALPGVKFDCLVAVSPYIKPFDSWLKQYKYHGRYDLAKFFASLMVQSWQLAQKSSGLKRADIVISVPLHLSKWRIRGYNQAHLIAKDFSDKLSLPYQPKLLSRIKAEDSQVGKSGKQRRKSLLNTFALNEPLTSNIKHVVIIDDVVTTGSTASEISKVLKSSGVEIVTLVTVCLTLPKQA